MTNYEKIKTLDVEKMALFLYGVETGSVIPRYVDCDVVHCNPCNCKDNMKCFISWLNAEYKGEDK